MSENPAEVTVETSGGTYIVQQNGSELQIGRHAEGTVLWQPETVPVGDLPDAARQALESGDTSSEDLLAALKPIVEAFVQRGG